MVSWPSAAIKAVKSLGWENDAEGLDPGSLEQQYQAVMAPVPAPTYPVAGPSADDPGGAQWRSLEEQTQWKPVSDDYQPPQAQQAPSASAFAPLDQQIADWPKTEPQTAASSAPSGSAPSAAVATGMPSPISATASASVAPNGVTAQDDGSLEGWARSEARRLGIDPNKAVEVAGTEGGFSDPVRQNMDGAPAFGPYQLYVGGADNPGLGDEALRAGIDPRNPAHARAAITFALEHARRNGWGAFQGAAAHGIGDWDGIGVAPQASVQAEQTPAAQAQAPTSVGRPTQFAEGLSYAEQIAACGLAGIAWFISKTGHPPQTVADVRDAAAATQAWDPGSGMHGAEATAGVLRRAGIATRVEDGVDWAKIRRDVLSGNPVMFDTNAGSAGHYYGVENARQRPDGVWEYDLGTSATDLRAARGRQWFTADEIPSLGFGTPSRTIYTDNPQTPAPSPAAGRAPNAPGAAPVSGIQPRAGGAALGGVVPEGSSLTAGGSPPQSSAAPPSAGPGVQPTGASTSVAYRQPLSQQPELPPGSTVSVTDQKRAKLGLPPSDELNRNLGVHEGIQAGDPIRDGDLGFPIDTRYPGNQPYDVTDAEGADRAMDPLTGGNRRGGPWQDDTMPQPPGPAQRMTGLDVPPDAIYRQPLSAQPELPNDNGYVDPDQGPREATPGSVGASNVQQYGPPESEAGPPVAPASPFKPLYDAAGAVVGYVQGAAETVGAAVDTTGQGIARAAQGLNDASRDPRNAANALGDAATAAGHAAYDASVEPPNDITNALPSLRGLKIVQDAVQAFGDVVGRRVADSMGWTDDEWFSVFGHSVSGQDVGGMIGSTVLDPTNYIGGGEAKNVAGAIREAAPGAARAIREGLAANAERVAELDARAARQGSTVAPAAMGQVPAEFGQKYPDIRGRISDAVEAQVGEPSAEMIRDSRMPRDAVHPDLRAAGIGPRITPAIDLSERANAAAGTVQVSVPRDRLAAVNNILAQGVASTFSGGTAAAAADQLGDPNDPNRQAKAFVAGALAPPLLARGGRALASRLGRGAEELQGGARIGLGDVPPSKVNQQGLPGIEHPPYTKPQIPDVSDVPNRAPVLGDVPPSAVNQGGLPGMEDAPPRPLSEVAAEILTAPAEQAPVSSARAAGGQTYLPTTAPGALSRIRGVIDPWLERLGTVRYAGMLSDTAGHSQNLQSNLALQLADVLTTPIAAALDVGRVGALRAAGRPAERQVFFGEVPAQLAGMGAGAREGLGQAAEIMRTGVKPGEAEKLDRAPSGFGTNIPGLAPAGTRRANLIDAAVEYPLRALSAADAIFRGAATSGHMAAESLAEATRINKGAAPSAEQIQQAMQSPKVRARVEELAARSVLQENRGVTDWYRKALKDAPPEVRTLIQTEVPFVRTPYNVMAQGMGLTDVGALAGVIEDVAKGKAARPMQQRLARAALGVGVMAWATADYANGTLTGPYPSDQKEASTLPPGWRPWSRKFEVGGETYYLPLMAAGPFAVPAVYAILRGEAIKKGKDAFSPEWAGDVAMAVGRYAEQSTFMEGLGEISKVFDERTGAEKIQQHVEQIAAQYSPHVLGGGGLGNEIQRIMGMPARDPDGPAEAMLATHPLTAGQVRPRQDILGREASRGAPGLGSALVRVGVEDDAGVIRAFRVANEGLSRAPKSIKDETLGKTKTLDADQRARWQRVFGRELRTTWVNAGNPRDKDSLSSIEAEARKAANETVLGRR